MNRHNQWLFEAPFPSQAGYSSASTQESYMDAMVAARSGSRPLSPTDIAKLTKQIEDRMRALGIPKEFIGFKVIAGDSGRGFDPNIKAPGNFVRDRGIAVGAGIFSNIAGWGAWNKASRATRIDAVIAHEWMRFKGASHEETVKKAHQTTLPIRDKARELLLSRPRVT
jgi:hypothetical protein